MAVFPGMAVKPHLTRVVPALSNTGSSFGLSAEISSPQLPSEAPWRGVRAVVAVSLGGLVVGTQLAILSGLLEMDSFAQALAPTTTDKAWLSAAYIAGAIAASFYAGPFVDKYGRRRALLFVAVLTLMTCVVMDTTFNSSMFLAARLIAGAGFAVINVAVPIYASEIAPTRLRGKFVSSYQLAITFGVLFAQLANLFVVRHPEAGFRFPLRLARSPSVAMLLAVYLYAPETPAWLESRGLTAEAVASRIRLGMPKRTASSSRRDGSNIPVLSRESESKNTLDLEVGNLPSKSSSKSDAPPTTARNVKGTTDQSHFNSMLSMLSNRSARRRFVVSVGVQVGQQLTGVNTVVFFAPTMLAGLLGSAGQSTDGPFVAAAGIGLINVLATILSFAVVEKFGRVTLLLTTAIPMIMSLSLLSVASSFGLSPWISVLAILLFICAFAIGWGPVPFLLSSEVFPISYRGRGMTLSSLVMNIASLLVTATFLHLYHTLGGGVFGLYACFTIFSAVFVWFVVPETRSVPLERIDAIFQ